MNGLKIMGIDTSATAASVSICEDGHVLSEFFVNVKLTHSQTMMPMVKAALDCARLSLQEIDVFAVSNGPGSFTGLRIGISAVKGMAFALEKPCIGISTLEAIARNALSIPGILCPVMDARVKQVYNALFESDGQQMNRLCPDRAVTIAELFEELQSFDRPVVLVGDGAELCAREFAGKLPQAVLVQPNIRYQRASSICALAYEEMKAGRSVSADALGVQYLRLPQAERERNARLQKEKMEKENRA